MKKGILLLVLGLSLLAAFVVSILTRNEDAHEDAPLTGWDMMNELGRGINIGNTLDARIFPDNIWWHGDPNTAMETIWGTARIEQSHFADIAEMGFNSVRIPISWEPRMDEDLNISPVFMDRVQQVVDWAIGEGLYVIINTHHEVGLYDYFSKNDYEGAKNWLFAVWGQIAEHFKDYSEMLIFEPINEPRPGWDGWFWSSTRQAAQIRAMSETLNRLNLSVLEFIRKSGGNNDRRIVILSTVQADSNTIHLHEHPDDPYTMLGTFFYHGEERQQLEQIAAALEKSIPVIIKETSPIQLPPERMLPWAVENYTALAQLGVPSFWWNTSGVEPEELLNRRTGEWVNLPLLEAFFTAYEAHGGLNNE
jgi:endoglucanase